MVGDGVVDLGKPAVFVDPQHDQAVADADADPVAVAAYGNAFAQVQFTTTEDWACRYEQVVVEAELTAGLGKEMPAIRSVDPALLAQACSRMAFTPHSPR